MQIKKGCGFYASIGKKKRRNHSQSARDKLSFSCSQEKKFYKRLILTKEVKLKCQE